MTNYRVTNAWDGVVRLVDHPVKFLTAVKDYCEFFLKMDCKGFAFFVNLFCLNGAKISSARTHQNIKMPLKNLDMQ